MLPEPPKVPETTSLSPILISVAAQVKPPVVLAITTVVSAVPAVKVSAASEVLNFHQPGLRRPFSMLAPITASVVST